MEQGGHHLFSSKSLEEASLLVGLTQNSDNKPPVGMESFNFLQVFSECCSWNTIISRMIKVPSAFQKNCDQQSML